MINFILRMIGLERVLLWVSRSDYLLYFGDKFFPTNFVSRDDIAAVCGADTAALFTDEMMVELASEIGESDTTYGTYWETIENFAAYRLASYEN